MNKEYKTKMSRDISCYDIFPTVFCIADKSKMRPFLKNDLIEDRIGILELSFKRA